jgi:hypothetical protein
LLEVVIARESFGKVALLHYHKADTVNHAPIRGVLYRVSESASGWTSEQPGNNLWPKTLGGSLNVVATMSSTWWSKTDSQKTAFIANNELNGTWPVSKENESLDSLNSSAGQKYASRGYGWERTNYSK